MQHSDISAVGDLASAASLVGQCRGKSPQYPLGPRPKQGLRALERVADSDFLKHHGAWGFFGRAVADAKNTADLKTWKEDAIAVAFMCTGRGDCIVYECTVRCRSARRR